MPLRNPLEGAGELCLLDAATLANAYRDRSLSPVEVAKATLARAATINADFNAFTFLDAKGALTAAEASAKRWAAGEPLSHVDGVPTTLKDIVWVEGWSVRYGSATTPPQPFAEDAPSAFPFRLPREGTPPRACRHGPGVGFLKVDDRIEEVPNRRSEV